MLGAIPFFRLVKLGGVADAWVDENQATIVQRQQIEQLFLSFIVDVAPNPSRQ